MLTLFFLLVCIAVLSVFRVYLFMMVAVYTVLPNFISVTRKVKGCLYDNSAIRLKRCQIQTSAANFLRCRFNKPINYSMSFKKSFIYFTILSIWVSLLGLYKNSVYVHIISSACRRCMNKLFVSENSVRLKFNVFSLTVPKSIPLAVQGNALFFYTILSNLACLLFNEWPFTLVHPQKIIMCHILLHMLKSSQNNLHETF